MTVPMVGLTGGIAAGKSAVARFFAELGIPIVDADQIAREVVEPGTEGLAAIVAEFGDDVLAPDGTLDRKRLGAMVFDDPAKRAALNAITHPRIAARSAQRLGELSEGDAPYVVYEAALLVENGIHRSLPALVVVAAEPETQIARMVERDGFTEQEARARIEAQLPLDEKLKVADFVIRNDGALDDTRTQVEVVHRKLVERFGAAG